MIARSYILLIDPSVARSDRLSAALRDAGYRVQRLLDATAAIPVLLAQLPLLIIADINFAEPRLLRSLREQNQIPLVLLLSEADHDNEISGFKMGADDVITRPDDREIFLARISAVLNRTGRRLPTDHIDEDDEPIVLGDLVVDPASLSVHVADEPLELSPREFMLLYTLAREAGTVVSRDALLEQVWGPDFTGETQTVYVYINWLRKKLRTHARESHRIITVHGVGYKLITTGATDGAGC